MPRVSVIVPAYHHERFVGECIRSVLAQTYADLEVVVVDDCSPDGTAAVVRAIDDPRVRLFVNERNLGACATANRCLAEARGEYIAVLSSDDAWEPRKLELQVPLLDQRPELGSVLARASIVDEEGAPVAEAAHFAVLARPAVNRSRHAWLRSFFLERNSLCHPSALTRASCYREVGGFVESMAQLPDLDFWVRLCARHELHVVDEQLVRFRVLAGERNASGDTPAKRRRTRTEFADILRRYGDLPLADLAAVFPEQAAPLAGAADGGLIVACACLAADGDPISGSIYRDVGLDLLRASLARRATDPWAWTWPVEAARLAAALPASAPWLAGSPDLPACVVVALIAARGDGAHATWGAHLLIDAFRDPTRAAALRGRVGPLEVIRLTGDAGAGVLEDPSVRQGELQVQLFFGGPDFAEERSISRFISPSPGWQRVLLASASPLAGRLRLDPIDAAGAIEIRSVRLLEDAISGRELRRFSAADGFAGLATDGDAVAQRRSDGLLVVSPDPDCRLLLAPTDRAPRAVEVELRVVLVDRQGCLAAMRGQPTPAEGSEPRHGLSAAIRKLRNLL